MVLEAFNEIPFQSGHYRYDSSGRQQRCYEDAPDVRRISILHDDPGVSCVPAKERLDPLRRGSAEVQTNGEGPSVPSLLRSDQRYSRYREAVDTTENEGTYHHKLKNREIPTFRPSTRGTIS